MAALTGAHYDLTAPGTSAHLAGMEVSSGFFATLGVKPALGVSSPRQKTGRMERVPLSSAIACGKTDSPEPGSARQAHGLDGADYTVIGILPPKFRL